MENRAGSVLAFILAVCVVGVGIFAILERGSSIVADAAIAPPADFSKTLANGTHLSAMEPVSPPSGSVFKCAVDGTVTYSDRPCSGAKLVDARPAMEGFQRTAPVRSAYVATDQPPRPEGRATPVMPTVDKSVRCAEVEARISQIDKQARQGGSAQYQDGLRDERHKLVDERYALKC